MAHNSLVALAVSTGAAAVCAGVLVWKLSSKYAKLDSCKGNDLCEVVQEIDVDTVGGLLSSPDAKIRKSAELFLINRASSQKNLTHFLLLCLCDDIDEVEKAVTVVHMLAQHSDELKDNLNSYKAVTILCDVIGKISNSFDYKYLVIKTKSDVRLEKIFYCTIGSLFHLVLRDTITTLQFCNEDLCIKDIFLNVIGDQGFHISTDVKRWTLFMVHQLILCRESHPIKKTLFQLGIVEKVTGCLIKTLGDILQTHLCLQILIQYLSGSTPTDIMLVCKGMISLGLTPHLVGLLRCEEDDNVIQLSAIIIHHFCCYEFEIKYLVSIPSMVKILFTVLNNTNANIQKTIIRICNYLCVASSDFHQSFVEYEPIIKRLSICLSSGNTDVVYGSLMLLHDLIMPGKEYAFQIINKNPDILKALVKLSLSYTGETVQLIPETLGFICSCESLHALILQHSVLDAILHFAKSSDVEVQFWASALLLNLSMISDEVKEAIIRSGGVHVLLEMAVSGDEVDLPDIATSATKTLVMMGFLDATMDVHLLSGLEGSIIVDGTEHCPGKQGINVVVFDFINYQFNKGKVIDPSELVDFFGKPEFTISDSVFFVTQGDCAISQADGNVMKKYLKHGSGNLSCPSWCWIYMPNDMKLNYSEDNIKLDTQIQMKDLLGTVLEENFTDPLIDVILSMPPSSNVNKLDELGLIEILARHYHQMKAIVSIAGFLEYLFELIWSVSSLNPDEYNEEANKYKVSHCISALKIIHSCSNHKSTLKELVHRGLLQPLASLLQDLITYCGNECMKSASSPKRTVSSKGCQESKYDGDVRNESVAKEFGDIIDEEPVDDECYISFLGDCVANLSYSDDNIFHSAFGSEAADAMSDLTIVNALSTPSASDTDFETSQNSRNTQVNVSTPNPQFSTRNRTDSFIVRTDTQNRHNQNFLLQRSLSLVDYSTYIPTESTTDTCSRSKSYGARYSVQQTPSDHHQLRRISRSMSLSLQQSKYTEDYSQINFSDDTLNTLGKYIVMIVYNLILNSDEEMKQIILEARVLPFMYGYISCITDGLHHERVLLAISSCLHHVASEGRDSNTRKGVYMNHVDIPRSIIIRSDGLELSNENWYFESVIANQPIGKELYKNEENHPDGWYYEVVIYTDGVMQIGWANLNCKFYPEKGCGVGDSPNSCGYDGARCKIWNGPCRDMIRENDYGIEWQKGDVISVVLGWDGELHYWLNGSDMGASLFTIDTDIQWFPALSLAIGQHCMFSFKETSLAYKPPTGYTTIDEMNSEFQNKTSNVKDFIPQTLDDLFRKVPHIPKDSFFLYYYEIDTFQMEDFTEICLGFTLFYNTTPNSEYKDGTRMKQRQSGESDVIEIIRSIPTTISDNGGIRKLKNVGCGILSDLSFTITIDGEKVFEKPIKSMINKDVDISNLFFDTIPYISNSHILVNFGQKEFTYEHANLSRFKLLDYLCKVRDA